MNGPNKTLRAVVLGLGYFFLYVPIISLMVFSFNESPSATSWSGFSLRWYHALANDDALLRAAWLSFRIAVLTATAAVIIACMFLCYQGLASLLRLSLGRGCLATVARAIGSNRQVGT